MKKETKYNLKIFRNDIIYIYNLKNIQSEYFVLKF